jgi:hypothetical protein
MFIVVKYVQTDVWWYFTMLIYVKMREL